uniref:Uncharacterized protein n=2 Tax=Sus scrofa TaxID=9823 RepID=A0A4X1TZZ1_PIG
MLLASMLEMPLAMNQDQFYRQGDHVDLPDLGPGYPGNGLSLVVPSGGVPEEPRIKMLHHTTILAFKILLGVIVAADSWDMARGPGLYYMDSEGNWIWGVDFSVGSRSVHAYGFMGYSYDLEVERAYDMARGLVNLYHVWEDGWIQSSSDNVAYLHYKYSEFSPCRRVDMAACISWGDCW